MSQALLVRPTRIDTGRLVQVLETTGLDVEVVDRLDPARPGSDHSPGPCLLFMDAPPDDPEMTPRRTRAEWILVPPGLDQKADEFCTEWGCWLVDDPFRRQTLLRKVVRSALELANLRRALGDEAWIHAVDDLWFPILDRLRRRLD